MTDREPPEDERMLIEAAKADPARFAELYERHFDRVYAYVLVRVRVRRRPEAEDLTSETFHKALAALPRFEWRGAPFSAWLFRIAANAISRHFDSRSPEPAGTETLSSGPVQEADAEESERLTRLYGAVRALPEGQRHVLTLRFSEETSIRETARRLKKSEGAVKQLQFRAIRALRARVGESDE